MKRTCHTRTVRVTTHKWGSWRGGMRRADATPFSRRKCKTCGKVQTKYGNRGY